MTDGHIQEEGKAARVRRHLQENKKTYLISAGASAGALAVGMVLGHRLSPTVIAPVFNNHNIGNVVNNTVNNGGHMHKIVQCVETGEIWGKVTDSAEAAGTSLSYMSRHLNGKKPDVFGKHYKIIGLGTDS